MKHSKHLNAPLLVGTLLSATVIAGSLAACGSSQTSRAEYEATSTDPTDPSDGSADPSAPGSSEEDPDASSTSADDECKLAPPTNACGVSPQCGCEPGQTCDVVSVNGSVRCVRAGETPMGHPCGSTADCAVGMTCVFGTCHAYCSDPGQACSQPGTGACVQVVTTDGDDIPNFAVCRVACEPHDPASCGGASCIIDIEGNTECQTGGSRAEGETCSPEEQCGPGLGCITSGDESTCRRWCRLGDDDCGPGESCIGFSPEVLVRGVPYGSCS